MPNNCMIFGCTNREGKSGVKMYRIPSIRTAKGIEVQELTERRQRLWLAAIGRKGFDEDTSLKSSHRVCSEHFVSGRPAYHMLDTDPDWVPSLNLGHDLNDTNHAPPIRRGRKKERSKVEPFTEMINGKQLERSGSAQIQANLSNQTSVENSQPMPESTPKNTEKMSSQIKLDPGAGDSNQSYPCVMQLGMDDSGAPAFVNEKSLHCPYPACEKTKQKLLQELNHALTIEKQLKARIECLHNIANVNLDLLRRSLDLGKSPQVEIEFKKVYELVQTIMNVQIWDVRAKLAHHESAHHSPPRTSATNNDQEYMASASSSSHAKDDNISNDNKSSTISVKNDKNKDKMINNINDYIDVIISNNSGIVNIINNKDNIETPSVKVEKEGQTSLRASANSKTGRLKSKKKHKRDPYFEELKSLAAKNVEAAKILGSFERRPKGCPGPGGLLCEFCGRWIIGRSWHYQNHLRSVHTGEKPFQCKKCGKRFHNRCTLSGHMPHCQNEDRPFQCKECGRLFKSKTNLMKHGLVHRMKEKIYSCPECNTKCKRYDSFRNHVRSKHDSDVMPVLLSVSTSISSHSKIRPHGSRRAYRSRGGSTPLTSHSRSSILPYGHDSAATHSSSSILPHVHDSVAPHSSGSILPHTHDSIATHSNSSTLPHAHDSLASHSSSSILPYAHDSIEPHSRSSILSHAHDSIESHSRSSVLSHGHDNIAPHSRSSILPQDPASVTSHSRSNILPHDPASVTSHSRSNILPHDHDSIVPHGRGSILHHAYDSIAPHSSSSILPHAHDSVALHSSSILPHTHDSAAAHNRSSFLPHVSIAPHNRSNILSHACDSVAPHSNTLAPHSRSSILPHAHDSIAPHSNSVAPHSRSNILPHTHDNVAPHGRSSIQPHSHDSIAHHSRSSTVSPVMMSHGSIPPQSSIMPYSSSSILPHVHSNILPHNSIAPHSSLMHYNSSSTLPHAQSILAPHGSSNILSQVHSNIEPHSRFVPHASILSHSNIALQAEQNERGDGEFRTV